MSAPPSPTPLAPFERRVLGVLAEEMFRHPASFYVSISYMCWSSRRLVMKIGGNGEVSFD